MSTPAARDGPCSDSDQACGEEDELMQLMTELHALVRLCERRDTPVHVSSLLHPDTTLDAAVELYCRDDAEIELLQNVRTDASIQQALAQVQHCHARSSQGGRMPRLLGFLASAGGVFPCLYSLRWDLRADTDVTGVPRNVLQAPEQLRRLHLNFYVWFETLSMPGVMPELVALICSARQLQSFTLSSNTGRDWTPMLRCLRQPLRELTLRIGDAKSAAAQASMTELVDAVLPRLPGLLVFGVSFQGTSWSGEGPGFDRIAVGLHHLHRLRRLSLIAVVTRVAVGARLSAALEEMPLLSSLDLSHSRLLHGGTALSAVLTRDCLQHVPQLRRLIVRECALSPREAASLASALACVPCLRTLDLDLNPLRRDGVICIARAVTVLSALHRLSMQNVDADDESEAELSAGMAHCRRLDCVTMPLTPRGTAAFLTRALPFLPLLTMLDLKLARPLKLLDLLVDQLPSMHALARLHISIPPSADTPAGALLSFVRASLQNKRCLIEYEVAAPCIAASDLAAMAAGLAAGAAPRLSMLALSAVQETGGLDDVLMQVHLRQPLVKRVSLAGPSLPRYVWPVVIASRSYHLHVDPTLPAPSRRVQSFGVRREIADSPAPRRPSLVELAASVALRRPADLVAGKVPHELTVNVLLTKLVPCLHCRVQTREPRVAFARLHHLQAGMCLVAAAMCTWCYQEHWEGRDDVSKSLNWYL